MKINLLRKTGFYGMGSAIQVFKNGVLETSLNNEGKATIETTESAVELMVKFSFLRSETYLISGNEQEEKDFQIKINPSIMRLYVSLFTLIFILPIIFKTWLLGLGILVLYIGFVVYMARKFYVIEEINVKSDVPTEDHTV